MADETEQERSDRLDLLPDETQRKQSMVKTLTEIMALIDNRKRLAKILEIPEEQFNEELADAS